MWHINQALPKDILVAQKILFALEHTGFKVFPDFKTAWHFDDKVAQKYLLERLGAPFVPSYAFFYKKEALDWASQAKFPKVFKLRGGAGSSNVKLVPDRSKAYKIIERAFSKGFSSYDPVGSLKERYRKWATGSSTFTDVLKGVARFAYPPRFSKVKGKEIGYVYFQDFIPNNDSDTRIIVIGDKAFALKRFVRKNDFRASGSGNFAYEKELFDERCVKIAFNLNKKIKSQCIAFDFVFDNKGNPLVVEVSYGFTPSGYDLCPGFWDINLSWHEGSFNPQGWMVDRLIEKTKLSP